MNIRVLKTFFDIFWTVIKTLNVLTRRLIVEIFPVLYFVILNHKRVFLSPQCKLCKKFARKFYKLQKILKPTVRNNIEQFKVLIHLLTWVFHSFIYCNCVVVFVRLWRVSIIAWLSLYVQKVFIICLNQRLLYQVTEGAIFYSDSLLCMVLY